MGASDGRSRARPIDLQRLASAMRSRIDTRLWVSFGTVGVLDGAGNFVTNDPDAIYPEPTGVLVDVRLEPTGHIVTANYHGICAGRAGSIFFPIMEGDAVVVLIPDGDLNSPAICALACGSNASAKIPRDWTSNRGTPRVLVDLNVPLEIRAPAVNITAAAQLKLNGRLVAPGSEPL